MRADAEQLLFVDDSEHPAVGRLDEAFSDDRPWSTLASIVAECGLDLPAFVFLRIGDRLRGVVCGEIEVRVEDGSPVSVDDSAAPESFAHLDASSAATVVCNTDEAGYGLWLERGVVRAGGFRWSGRRDEAGPAEHSAVVAGAYSALASEPVSGEARSGAAEPRPASGADPVAAPAGDKKIEQAPERPSLLQALGAEFDDTIDAIQYAEIRGESSASEPARRKRRKSTARAAEPGADGLRVRDASDDAENAPSKVAGHGPESDATIDLGPGQVMLGGAHLERRMVDALVCLACNGPNPPAAVRCRYCAALLSSANTDILQVPQPVLGVVHLSGGREELLDADLVIGRNPGYLPLDRYQRAVVHAEDDRSVSRRHIELRLDQWKVLAMSLKPGSATTVKNSAGRRSRLRTGHPRQLKAGDTLLYGSAWLRFEPEE